MADQEQKALELITQAEKKLKSSTGFLGSLMGLDLHASDLMSSDIECNVIYIAPLFIWRVAGVYIVA